MMFSALLFVLATVAFSSAADERLRVSNAAVTSKLQELNRRRLFGSLYPWGNIDNSCGSNGNNYGQEILRKMAYSSCLCAEACEKHDQCVGWTYIPTGIFADMGMLDCVLRSSWGGMVDNCGGRCLSGTRTNALCTVADCNNNAVSVSGHHGIGCQCSCSPGWGGERCERQAQCACENGGTAATGAACVKDGFQCATDSCPEGRRGKFCHLEWSDPEPTPCASGGEYCVCTGKAYHAERCQAWSMWWSDCTESLFSQIQTGGPNQGIFYAEKSVTSGIWCKPDQFGITVYGWSSTDKRCWCDNVAGWTPITGAYPGTQHPVAVCGNEADQNDVIGQEMQDKYGISGIVGCGSAASYCESLHVQSLCPYTCGRCKQLLDLDNPLNNIGLDIGLGAGSGFFG